MKLLSREKFNELAFKRDNGKCVWCGNPGIDVHHIIERKLWKDGGYYLSNSAVLCSSCHIDAEQNRILPYELWDKIKIIDIILPNSMDINLARDYDKWGNIMEIFKYPRTRHVEGSRLQAGDEDLDQVPLSELYGKHLVIESKEDGANSGISFINEELKLQSRGHFLTGGPREAQFQLFKQWANTFQDDWYLALGDKYVAYGEWLYSKHTVYYDQLPHYWMEFDILDKEKSTKDNLFFLDTPSRHALLQGIKYCPVKVLWSGTFTKDIKLADFIGYSYFKSKNWKEAIKSQVNSLKYDYDLIWKHTDHSDLMEGLYLKWEEDGQVKGRYKFVREDFVSLLTNNDMHHINLPIVPNKLAEGVDLFI